MQRFAHNTIQPLEVLELAVSGPRTVCEYGGDLLAQALLGSRIFGEEPEGLRVGRMN